MQVLKAIGAALIKAFRWWYRFVTTRKSNAGTATAILGSLLVACCGLSIIAAPFTSGTRNTATSETATSLPLAISLIPTIAPSVVSAADIATEELVSTPLADPTPDQPTIAPSVTTAPSPVPPVKPSPVPPVKPSPVPPVKPSPVPPVKPSPVPPVKPSPVPPVKPSPVPPVEPSPVPPVEPSPVPPVEPSPVPPVEPSLVPTNAPEVANGQPVFTGTSSNITVDPPWYPCQKGQIKGNNNSKIYHTPAGRSYDKTFKNVTCFNTEAEAEVAGFRAAKN